VNSPEPTLPWLSDAVLEVYAAESPAQLATAAIGAIMPRFRSTICGLEELGYDRRSNEVHGVRLTAPLPPDFADYVHDHPGMGRILGGERDAEIAIILGCAPATESKHVERILAKLRVGSRTEAVHASASLAPPGKAGTKP
jgi:hypothetical protein